MIHFPSGIICLPDYSNMPFGLVSCAVWTDVICHFDWCHVSFSTFGNMVFALVLFEN